MIDIDKRRECFFDSQLIDPLRSSADLMLHHPQFRETVLVHNAPWEGDGCNYHNLFFDPSWHGIDGSHPEGVYRMYYLGWEMISADGKRHKVSDIHVCYAESADGISWTKPNLGICPFNGDKNNNIILCRESVKNLHPNVLFDNFMAFRDENPACSDEQRYKGIGTFGMGLWCFHSPDGIHFTPAHKLEIKGRFDSLNIIFWDSLARKYRGYIRDLHPSAIPGEKDARDIRYTESEDFVNWTPAQQIRYDDEEDIPLYTSCISQYLNAPHLLVGFPSRYVERKEWNSSFEELCGKEKRQSRMKIHPRYGLAVTDCIFMVSRNGMDFHRFGEAFMRPEIENGRNWVYGDCYPARGFAVTKSPFPGAPDELSMYVFTNHWMGIPSTLDRYSIRMDGFASLHAGAKEEHATTKVFVFQGNDFFINFETSALGYMQFTISDFDGNECSSCEVFGNSLDRKVHFENGTLSAFAGKPVRMHIRMRDADLYSLQFR